MDLTCSADKVTSINGGIWRILMPLLYRYLPFMLYSVI